jgi:ribonuclease VapC
MVVDSSAVIAILFQEADAEAFSAGIGESLQALISAVSVLEVVIVLRGRLRRLDPDQEVDAFISGSRLKIEPVSLRQLGHAREAHRRFGRGSGHPARLNFGDCFAYALAKERGLPLLFKGDDFIHTDIRPALPHS